MKKIYTKFFLIAMAALLVMTDGYGQEEKRILFVGRDNLGDYQSDQDLFDSLTAWGYTPEFWDSNGEYDIGIDADFNALDYSNYIGMFVNETVDSKAMARFGPNADPADNYPVPSVNLEGYCVAAGNDRWGWLNDNGTELFQTPDAGGTEDDQVFVVEDNSHYILSVFNQNDEIPWSTADIATDIASNRPVSIAEVNVTYSGKLGAMKSHSGQANFWNMVTVDEIGPDNVKAFFWGLNHIGLNGEAQDGSYGTPEFYTIIKRACGWAFDDAEDAVSVNEVQADPLSLTTYPNPASDRVNVRFHAGVQGMATATLYNIAGQQVMVNRKQVVAGTNQLYLDTEEFASGIYHLRVEAGGETSMAKVVIQ